MTKAQLERLRRSRLRLEAMAERMETYRRLAAAGEGEGSEAVEALAAALQERMAAWAGEVREAQRRIDALKDARQRDVLCCRYLNGWSWRQIGERLGYCPAWVYRIHRMGLEQLLNMD